MSLAQLIASIAWVPTKIRTGTRYYADNPSEDQLNSFSEFNNEVIELTSGEEVFISVQRKGDFYTTTDVRGNVIRQQRLTDSLALVPHTRETMSLELATD